MNNDDGGVLRANRPSQLKWDRKKKKMVSTGQVGADNKKMIRSESGALLPASYKSGRFEEWRKKRKHAGIDGRAEEREARPTRFHANVSYSHTRRRQADLPQSRHAAQHRSANAARSEIKTTSQIMGQRQLKAKVSAILSGIRLTPAPSQESATISQSMRRSKANPSLSKPSVVKCLAYILSVQ